MSEELVQLFAGIGLDPTKAKEAAKNNKLSSNLKEVITEAKVGSGCEKSVGMILYQLATKYPPNALKHRSKLCEYIVAKKVTNSNLAACLEFLRKTANEELNVAEFEQSCGVGVVITREQVAKAVAEYLAKNQAELLEQRYHFNINAGMATVRQSLMWAESKDIKEEIDAQVLALLGPKTEKDLAPPPKKAAPKEEEREIRFPDPKENVQATPKLLQDHLNATGGKIVTRFPPEPNGYLHIGHAKAMYLDFGYAKQNGGKCYLRFDDTNPEKENQEYIDSIIDSVKWLGHEPCEITYSSQYFDQLYEMAVELIKRGYAYVCHQTAAEIAEGREKMTDSPWRNRTVEENLKIFEDMKKGKIEEGKAILRMKGDMKHDNPCMRDLIAYRIKFHHHPVSGDKWCIYPSYDFTHCLVDSIENITHSLCTLEFEIRRLTYNWLIDVLGLYRPVVWEYARLNLTNTVLSKRKLITLVQKGIVSGWDDPRLSTLNAFRRKGYTPEAINLLCQTVGVTRTNNTVIPYSLLEHCCRQDLNEKAVRAMVVLEPIKVVITNYPEDQTEDLEIANIPTLKEKGTHKVSFSKVVYIERSDFRLEDHPDFFGLAPGKEVLLKYAYNIKCNEVVKDEAGNVVELRVTYDKNNTNKTKTIHWVSSPAGQNPIKIEVRLYEPLFLTSELGDDWLEQINPKSLQVINGAVADNTVVGSKEFDRYQFERTGYFCCDKDSTPEKLVFNRIVSLKEDKVKAQLDPKAKPDPRKKAK
eukprot:gene10669-13068_t